MAKKPSTTSGPKFKKGDIVYLVNGGPSMSISEIDSDYHGLYTGYYRCQWFAGKKLDSGKFPEESLTATDPKP